MTRGAGTRVGVTGHRAFADPDAVLEAVHKALADLERQRSGEPLVAVSALAEGADRIVARAILARPDARLVAALPMPAVDYARDFDADSATEFHTLLARADRIVVVGSQTDARSAAYQAAGRWVVENCDVLLAVWDGRPPRGPGGTAEVVAYADAVDCPIVWVRAERAVGLAADGAAAPTPTPA